MAETVLHYFEGRGRGEIVRLMLAAGNMPFKSVWYEERADFVQAIEDGKLLFRAVPMLHVDNKDIVQTNTIIHYLARRNGMDGETPDEKLQADIYFEGSRDLYMPFLFIGFRGTAKEIAASAEGTVLPKFLPVFNKALAKSASGYLVGSKLTYADVGLLEVLFAFEDFYEEDKLADYPSLKAFLTKMKKEDWVIRYFNEVRMRPNDDRYLSTVKRVLNLSLIT